MLMPRRRAAPALALALAACAAQPAPARTCAPDDGDQPGAPLVRRGLDPAGVDAARARRIAAEVAAAELRRVEDEQRKHRPDFHISAADYDIQEHEDVRAVEGCDVFEFFYVYRQPAGRELGPGHPSHFNVVVYRRDGRARIVQGH